MPGATAEKTWPSRGEAHENLFDFGLRLSVQVECFSGAAGSSSVSVQLQCGSTLDGGATTDGGCSEVMVAVLMSRRNRPRPARGGLLIVRLQDEQDAWRELCGVQLQPVRIGRAARYRGRAHPVCLHIDPAARPVHHGEVHRWRGRSALARERPTPAAAAPRGGRPCRPPPFLRGNVLVPERRRRRRTTIENGQKNRAERSRTCNRAERMGWRRYGVAGMDKAPKYGMAEKFTADASSLMNLLEVYRDRAD